MIRTGNMENNSKSLIIFDHFDVDQRLVKHSKANFILVDGLGDKDTESDGVRVNPSFVTHNGIMVMPTSRAIRRRPSMMFEEYSIKWFIAEAILKIKEFIVNITSEKIESVMVQIKASATEIEVFKKRDEILKENIENAKSLGQSELLSRLESELVLSTMENVLYSKGFPTYLTEAQILLFGSKCEKGLCLDWVSDFVRIIPKHVIEEKKKADALLIFDNYVVLHYDPNGIATNRAAREKQEAKIRDPILFGVIKESRKLYYIADWVDEKCDLTLDQVLKSIAQDSKKL